MADLTAGRNFGIIIPETKLHHHYLETSPRYGGGDAGFPSCSTRNIMSFDLVFFGGTGDLTWRKLMPALFQAFRHGKLPEGGRILAVARDERTDDEYRAFIKERFVEVDRSKQPSDEEFAPLRRAAALPPHGPVQARRLRRA